jgi:alpha-galactosidase/6-phospho-beta-glucosidase family protein
MKIAVIGGAGVRTPLLVSGLTASNLPIDEISLYDTDQTRLSIIGPVAEQMACAGDWRGRVRLCRSFAEAIAWADFVFTSIRVGGIERRSRDEATAQRHGIVGQETIGPAGFAMATRTIPQMVRYAQQIADAAPRAWIVNFTNPVGMVTEAMRTVTDRVIGICDTPTELFDSAARALDLDPGRCSFDYFGLNHLGWLREVYSGGEPHLHRLWNDAGRLKAIYKMPLFDSTTLRGLKLLPTEYVYYYDQPTRAFENVRRAGRSRGQTIEELNRALFDALGDSQAGGAERYDRVARYRTYLSLRSGTYMQIESGAYDPNLAAAPSTLGGYDKIAASVVRAIHFNTHDVIPLSVENHGNLSDLRDSDVVEVPCVVDANGARALHVGRVPDRVRPLLQQVKEYERLTVAAALAQSLDGARAALAANPLVPNRAAADALVDDLAPLW